MGKSEYGPLLDNSIILMLDFRSVFVHSLVVTQENGLMPQYSGMKRPDICNFLSTCLRRKEVYLYVRIPTHIHIQRETNVANC